MDARRISRARRSGNSSRSLATATSAGTPAPSCIASKIEELRQCAERELGPASSDPRLQLPVPDQEGSASFDRFTQRDNVGTSNSPAKNRPALGDASVPGKSALGEPQFEGSLGNRADEEEGVLSQVDGIGFDPINGQILESFS